MERLKDYIDPSWTRIFEIPGFAERMGQIRGVVRPGLKILSEHLSEILNRKGIPVFPHVASHMRRRINPPHETWLALGPEKRGYKAYGHFGLFIGKDGCSIRLVVKSEAEGPKKALGAWLSGSPEAKRWFRDQKGLRDYDAVHGTSDPAPELSGFPSGLGDRLLSLRTSGLDLGWPLPFETGTEDLVKRLVLLAPPYRAANGS